MKFPLANVAAAIALCLAPASAVMGAPAADGLYRAGARDGRWRFWDDHGALTTDVWYRDGRRVAPGDMLPERP